MFFNELADILAKDQVVPGKGHALVLHGLTDESLSLLTDNTTALKTNAETVAKMMQQTEGKASEYVAYNILLNPGMPYKIAPYDLSRMRLIVNTLLSTGATGQVQLGTLSNVQSSSGFPLVSAAPGTTVGNPAFEMTGEVYVQFYGTGTVQVGVYMEKNVI